MGDLRAYYDQLEQSRISAYKLTILADPTCELNYNLVTRRVPANDKILDAIQKIEQAVEKEQGENGESERLTKLE